MRIYSSIKKHYLLIPSITLYTLLFLPFFTLLPYLDGYNEFYLAYSFFKGNYFEHWLEYEPPIKSILLTVFFHLFGIYSYTFAGYLLGLLGIISIFLITKKLFDKKTALLASYLLATSGLYVSTSVFSLNDFMVTIFILLSFALYVHKKYIVYAVCITIGVLSKETTILFPLSILLVDLYRKRFRYTDLLPFLALLIWILYVHLSGHALWNDWNFSKTASGGSLYTIANNIVTLSVFNQYAYENWLHLLFLNFNWVFWILTILYVIKGKRNDNFYILVLFAFLYSFLVLSFQTFSIARYVLPILPFLYIYSASYISKSSYQKYLIPLVVLVIVLSLFSSSDPISNMIWRKDTLLSEKVYTSNLDGRDGMTYNMEFLFAAKRRNAIIYSNDCKSSIDLLDLSKEEISIFNLQKCK